MLKKLLTIRILYDKLIYVAPIDIFEGVALYERDYYIRMYRVQKSKLYY